MTRTHVFMTEPSVLLHRARAVPHDAQSGSHRQVVQGEVFAPGDGGTAHGAVTPGSPKHRSGWRWSVRSGRTRPAHRQGRYLFDAYGLPPSEFEMAAIARWARTLLPASSSGGEITAMPNLPGDTAMMPPPTPLLAGRPVW